MGVRKIASEAASVGGVFARGENVFTAVEQQEPESRELCQVESGCVLKAMFEGMADTVERASGGPRDVEIGNRLSVGENDRTQVERNRMTGNQEKEGDSWCLIRDERLFCCAAVRNFAQEERSVMLCARSPTWSIRIGNSNCTVCS